MCVGDFEFVQYRCQVVRSLFGGQLVGDVRGVTETTAVPGHYAIFFSDLWNLLIPNGV